MTDTRKPTKAGATELSERQLDDVSGGPLIIRIWDYKKGPQQQKKTTTVIEANGFDGEGND